MSRRLRAFTLVEILVSIAILVILFGLMFRPLLMALEIISIGRGEQQAQQISRSVVDQVTEDLQSALLVYSNLQTYDLSAFAAGRIRTPQTARLDLVLPARDAQGRLLTPVRPACLNGDPAQPLVVTYWRMRDDPLKDYDPQFNPYRLYRAMHAYNTATAAANVRTPDDLWAYLVQLGDTPPPAESLTLAGQDALYQNLFLSGGPFDWFVADLDRYNPTAGDPSTMPSIMRSPTASATYNNASGIQAVSALTPLESDAREVSFVPTAHLAEELRLNDSATAYRGELARWVQPYQRETPGAGGQPVWVLPSSDLVPRSGGQTPLLLVGVFRASGTRSALLGGEYFIGLDQTPGATTEGRPILYRMPSDTSANPDPVPVYDLTDYPTRVFRNAPGEVLGGNDWSGEFACGLNWATGELTTVFPQTDVICPAESFGEARIHAYNDPAGTGGPNPPVYAAGSNAATEMWQSFALTTRAPDGTPQVGVNGALLDEFVLDRAGLQPGVWNSYTVSAFRPERLRTGTDQTFNGTPSAADRRLDMSIVPGSEQVVVVQYDVAQPSDVATATPIRRVVYTPLRSASAGTLGAGDLDDFRYYLDPATGRLTFYDPQLDQDNTDPNRLLRDGLNPPAVVANPAAPARFLVPVIYVTYEYRNNLPTIANLLLSDRSNRDVVQMSYRSLEAIDFKLVLDVPTESTRGSDESLADPLAASPIDRPTGARKRVVVQTTLAVGSRP